MADRFWVLGTGNWDAATTTHWSATSGGAGGASVPTSSDNVFFDSLSSAVGYTVTVTATANCLDLTFAQPLTGVVTLAGSSAINTFGNVTFASGMTRTWTGALKLDGVTQTVTTNGVALGGTVNASSTGSVVFQDALVTTGQIQHTDTCDLNFNDLNVTCANYDGSASFAKTLSLGSGILTLTGTGTVFTISMGTVTATTGTIRIANTSASTKTFAGAGKTFNILDVTTGGSGAVIITGANTFTRITATGGSTKTFTLPGSTTTTLTGTTPLPSGAASNLLTFAASAGSATVALTSEASIDYVSLTNIVASGTVPAYAGTHSTNGGGNTNWLFSDPPAGGGPMGAIFAPLLLLS